MAGKALSFTVLLSFAILAIAGSRSPADVQLAAPLQNSAAAAGGNDDYECVYTIYVETGSIWKAGTDSVIGLGLRAADGGGFAITDLARWGGLMGAGHDYYERGSVDIFSGRGPCMREAPCAMNLTSDGAGAHHGWYCNYLEVTATGPHLGCAQQLFTVEQWLATDAPPYRLYSAVDKCGKKRGAADGGGAAAAL